MCHLGVVEGGSVRCSFAVVDVSMRSGTQFTDSTGSVQLQHRSESHCCSLQGINKQSSHLSESQL